MSPSCDLPERLVEVSQGRRRERKFQPREHYIAKREQAVFKELSKSVRKSGLSTSRGVGRAGRHEAREVGGSGVEEAPNQVEF